MKRIIFILSFVFIFLVLPLSAYAADNKDASGVAITVVIPKTDAPKTTPSPEPTKPPTNYLYPVSVYEIRDDGRREIIKTYELDAGEKPGDISRESFIREGWMYELTDIVKRETATGDSREYVETVEINTDTKDTEAIMKLLAQTLEYQSDDGYIGVLKLDIASIKVETAGTKSSSYTVSATREYPHLSSNDTSLIPKTISDNGRTLTLSNIEWKTQNSTSVDYDQIAVSYTAVAKYTGTAYKTSITGYTTTAEYCGTISKIITGKTVYTANFLGVQIITPSVNTPSTSAPEATSQPTTEPKPAETETGLPTETEAPATSEPKPTETPENTAPTETTGDDDTFPATEPEAKPFNPLPIIIIVLAAAGISGGGVYFYLQKVKKGHKRE